MGDLNDQPGTLMYQVLTGAGFTDVWAELRPGVAGLTCCHETDLSDKLPAFDQQVDYVFARGFAHANRDVLGQITRFGMLAVRPPGRPARHDLGFRPRRAAGDAAAAGRPPVLTHTTAASARSTAACARPRA